MPSTDETFYNLKRLHVLFAISSLALLAATVWLIVADHCRQWKVYQRTFRDQVEPWFTEARIQQHESAEFASREQELAEAVAKARAAVPEQALIERFKQAVAQDAARRAAPPPDFTPLDAAYTALASAPSAGARQTLADQLELFLKEATFRQQNAERQLRFRRAEMDEARAAYESAAGAAGLRHDLARLREKATQLKHTVDCLAVQAEESSAHTNQLAQILAEIGEPLQSARQALAEHRAVVDRLERALVAQRPSRARWLLSLPFIEAVGRPLAIDQIWLPELTINYNFRQVARFDRCITCHQGIDKTAPGSLSEPAYCAQSWVESQLATPAKAPQAGAGQGGRPEMLLRDLYGLVLAPKGLLDPRSATIQVVVPKTRAAWADLQVGDVIAAINDTPVASRSEAIERLLNPPKWGEPWRLAVLRGLPQPYSSHPRLDLFVGSLSPHPATTFGCTICHEGQGSATEFRFASHTPDTPADRARWRREHGWFWNPDWDFPMLPKRFLQSGCLKCHPDVTDLEPSRRFPDPPAQKLLAGYQLVRRYGCFGCHEIRGISESLDRTGPDMRLEPNYHEAAQALVSDAGLTPEQRALAQQLAVQPDRADLRRRLVAAVSSRGAGQGGDSAQENRLQAASAKAIALLATEHANPGTMRKVGPSLRSVAHRLDAAILESIVRRPRDFRPDSRMPQLFGLDEHLQGKTREMTRRLEAVEVRAIREYLLSVSQPIEPLPVPPTVTEKTPSAERGKRLFSMHGCLACHKHSDFPEAVSYTHLTLPTIYSV